MKKRFIFGVLSISIILMIGVPLQAQSWQVYDGGVLPSATGSGEDSLDISNVSDDSPGAGMVQEIMDDPDISGNKIFKYLHPDGKTTFRHYFDDAFVDSNFTMVARIKGELDEAYDRAFDIRWDNKAAGTRDELRIWTHRDSLELEKADIYAPVGGSISDWHTYRIVVTGDIATIYIDENSTPIVSGTTTASTSNSYLKLGDGSGDAIGGYLDWFVLDTSGAYGPGEGADFPAGLYVDGLVTEPEWMVYDGSVLPSETSDADGGLDISNVSDNSPGDGMVQEIIDDPSISGNKIFKYLHPDGKTTFRHYFDDSFTDSSFTIIARIKGELDEAYDRAFDIRWDNKAAGTRDELRLWTHRDSLELEKADIYAPVGGSVSEWQTYRISVNGDIATIYINEDPTPIVTGTTTSSTSNSYMKIGDGSGDAIGGYLDWMIVDISGAYAPGEGLDIPEELYVDGQPEPQKWLVYDGSVLPENTDNEGSNLDISNVSDNSPGDDMTQEIIDDDEISGNKILKYLQPNGKTNFRHYFDDTYTDSSFTIVARVKGDTSQVFDRAFDFEWRNGNAGTRDKLYLWSQDSQIELDNEGSKVDAGVSLYDWHTYRITVNGDIATVYIDEDSVAVHSAVTTNTTSDTYLKIGDGSSAAIGGYLDWIIMDMSGAYGPGEGLDIPAYLYVDGGPEPAKWLVYDGSVLPTTTTDGGDTLDLSNISDNAPGDGLVAEIIDDPDEDGNKLFKYLNPDGKTMYRHYFDEDYEDSTFTIVTRLKGEMDETFDRVFDIQWRNGNAGSRDELRIAAIDSILELEKSDVSINYGTSLYEWHTYRIAVNGDKADVYVDENEEAVLSGVSTSSSSDTYVKVGDGSGDAIGGYMDWMILDMSGHYAPGEGLDIPEDLIVDEGPQPIVPKWYVYDASVMPEETDGAEGDSLDISSLSDNSPGDGLVAELMADPDVDGNSILKYLHPDGKLMYRHYFDERFVDSSFTMIARVKAEKDETYDRAFDLQWRHGNANVRDELRISAADSTLELEKADVKVKVDMDLYEWHTYRIVVKGGYTEVFVDEYEEPYVSGTSTEGTSDQYIKIGDGSSENIGGYLDWLILDISDAYVPGEGLDIPSGLEVDEYEFIATPGWKIYDGSILPTETVDTLDLLDLSSLSEDSPGDDMVEEIIADEDIEGNYLFKYLQPTSPYKRMYRTYFNDYWKGTDFTLIARVKGLEGYDQSLNFQWRHGNASARDELRIFSGEGRLKLDKSDIEVYPDYSLNEWHTFRMAVKGDSSKIYVDENPTPILAGKSGDGTSDSYIKIGDRGDGTLGALLDWMILDCSGAYAPGEEVVAIPEELEVDQWDVAIDNKHETTPKRFYLAQNYPNPFNPTTNIRFEMAKSQKVTIKLYNLVGQEVMTIVDNEMKAGYHSVVVDARTLASGMYFYRMTSGNFVMNKKMLLLK